MKIVVQRNSIYRLLSDRPSFVLESPQLPSVNCDSCGISVGGHDVVHPLLPFDGLASISFRLWPSRQVRRMGWTEFRQAVAGAKINEKELGEVRPLAHVGPFDVEKNYTWPEDLAEVEGVSSGGPLLRIDILERLAEQKICLQFLRVVARDKRARTAEYGILQAPVIRALHSTSLEPGFHSQCSICGEIKILQPLSRRQPVLRISESLRASLGHAFRVVGFENLLLISNELSEALARINPVGLKLGPCGEWSQLP